MSDFAQRRTSSADCTPASSDEPFAGFDDVLDLQVNDGADDEIAAAFVGQIAVLLFHQPRGVCPEADAPAKIFFRQQSGIQAVVEVVAVIGDFVGEIGDLRLERGVFGDETFFHAGPVKGRLVLGQAFEHFPREIEAGEIRIFLLQFLDDAEAVVVVLKAAVAAHQFD